MVLGSCNQTGVDNVEIDMPSQKVTVTGSIDQKKILKTVRRTGRRAVLWPYPFNTQVQTQHLYQHHHPALAQSNHMGSSSSSYNYYKHGYDNSHLHYGHSGHSAVNGERTGDLFSDENPHACSVMWNLYCIEVASDLRMRFLLLLMRG
jgi:Heavy-metal-associated domain